MRYKNAREFLKETKPKIMLGRQYFTVTQVTGGLGVHPADIYRLIQKGVLDKRLGFEFVES